MNDTRGDSLERSICCSPNNRVLYWGHNLGDNCQNTQVFSASEATWQKIRKDLQEIAEAYLKEMGYVD